MSQQPTYPGLFEDRYKAAARAELLRVDRRANVMALLLSIAALVGITTSSYANEPPHASEWVKDQASRARLVAGGLSKAAGEPPRLFAGIEISLDDGWKTYWRNPGTSGVPPRFDFAGSENVAEATPLYPAPMRFTERDGDTIGYKATVVFPIEIKPADAKKPVTLKLAAEYGVCKDVCIPVQPSLTLVLPPDAASKPAGPAIARAVEQVPRAQASARASDPKLAGVKFNLTGDKPTLTLDSAFPGDAKGADIFLEAPDGIWIPLPKRVGDVKGGRATFVVDLTDGVDLADLRGRSIRATLVSTGGQSETSFKFE